MKHCDVDSLAQSLGLLAAKAQQRINTDRQRLSTTIDIAADGTPRSVNWECRVPSGDGKERPYNLLKIPWESFYSDEPMIVSEISVEFGCTVSRKKGKDSATQYILKPKNRRINDSKDEKAQQQGDVLKIMLSSESEFQPELLLNEQQFEEYLESDKQEKKTGIQLLRLIKEYMLEVINYLKRLIIRR